MTYERMKKMKYYHFVLKVNIYPKMRLFILLHHFTTMKVFAIQVYHIHEEKKKNFSHYFSHTLYFTPPQSLSLP